MPDPLLFSDKIEVSINSPLSHLRDIAVAASPEPAGLLRAQRELLRGAIAQLRRKGLSTDTETYRRLGILIPHWRYPEVFEQTLRALRDYWRRHRAAKTLGNAAPYRQARDKASEYLRMMASFSPEEDDEENDDSNSRYAHLLPSSTDVRVFRLVNGNLEVPSTLLKALTSAGRISDVFFPDEPSTWQLDSTEGREAGLATGVAGAACGVGNSGATADESWMETSSVGSAAASRLFGNSFDVDGEDSLFVDPIQPLDEPLDADDVQAATIQFLQEMQRQQQPQQQQLAPSRMVTARPAGHASNSSRSIMVTPVRNRHGNNAIGNFVGNTSGDMFSQLFQRLGNLSGVQTGSIMPILICPIPIPMPAVSAAFNSAMASAMTPFVVPANNARSLAARGFPRRPPSESGSVASRSTVSSSASSSRRSSRSTSLNTVKRSPSPSPSDSSTTTLTQQRWSRQSSVSSNASVMSFSDSGSPISLSTLSRKRNSNSQPSLTEEGGCKRRKNDTLRWYPWA